MAGNDGKPLVIVYHAECVDGAACAWAVSKKHGVDDEKKHPNVTYIPYAHHAPEAAEKQIREAMKQDATVYFVDVAPRRQFLDEMMTPDEQGVAKVAQINIMDHHGSQTRDLKNYVPPYVDGGQPGLNMTIDPNKRSAAKMVWTTLLDEPPPPVLDLIDKMDGDGSGLVTHEDFAAAAAVDVSDIATPAKAFDTLRGLAKSTFNDIAKSGGSLVGEQEERITKLLHNLSIVNIQILPDQQPVPVAIVNADVKLFGRHISQRLVDAGNVAGSGVAFAWFMQKNGAVTMSIRTSGEPDASLIAAHLRTTMGVTGGGHEGAGAVHFKNLFEFAKNIPFANAMPYPPAPKPMYEQQIAPVAARGH